MQGLPRWMALLMAAMIGVPLGGCRTTRPSVPTTSPLTTPASVDSVPVTDLMGQVFLEDVDGRSRNLSEFLDGKATLVSFWATYCGPCKQKIEDHQLLHDTFADDGLTIIAISVDEPETIGQVRTFVSQRRLTLPVLLDRDCQLIDQLNPRRTLPFSLLIDGEGRTVWTHEGYAPGDRELFEQVVREALGEESQP